jgi:ribonuclease R
MYRIHEMPDPKRIVEFEDAAAAFGVSLGVGALPVKTVTMKADRRDQRRQRERGRDGRNPHQHEVSSHIEVEPQMYQRLASKIQGRPEERILSYLMLRSLKQAKYSEKNEGHFALAAPAYTHFTSPIRRYPDLIVHRVVKTLLAEGASPYGGPEETASSSAQRFAVTHAQELIHPEGYEEPYPREEIAAIAQECSETERRAADAERELIEWKKIEFMSDRVGEDFAAMVLSVTKYGAFVELHDLYVEGIVPIHSLTDDHYTYRENARELRGSKSGKAIRPGMQVRVLLDRIDRGNRRLQFAILPEEESATGEGTRPFVSKRGDKAARRKENQNAPKAQRARPAKKGGKSRAGKPQLSTESPFAKFATIDGVKPRRRKNKDLIAASKKKGKRR